MIKELNKVKTVAIVLALLVVGLFMTVTPAEANQTDAQQVIHQYCHNWAKDQLEPENIKAKVENQANILAEKHGGNEEVALDLLYWRMNVVCRDNAIIVMENRYGTLNFVEFSNMLGDTAKSWE